MGKLFEGVTYFMKTKMYIYIYIYIYKHVYIRIRIHKYTYVEGSEVNQLLEFWFLTSLLSFGIPQHFTGLSRIFVSMVNGMTKWSKKLYTNSNHRSLLGLAVIQVYRGG